MPKLIPRSALRSHWRSSVSKLGAPWPLYILGFALILGLALR